MIHNVPRQGQFANFNSLPLKLTLTCALIALERFPQITLWTESVHTLSLSAVVGEQDAMGWSVWRSAQLPQSEVTT